MRHMFHLGKPVKNEEVGGYTSLKPYQRPFGSENLFLRQTVNPVLLVKLHPIGVTGLNQI
jgi:hypothetical protein